MTTPEPLFPFRVADGRLYTPGGYAVVCDGCRTHLAAPLNEATQVYPVHRPELWPPGTYFIVCPPPPDGPNACLDLAVLEESLDTPCGPDCGCGACLVAFHGRRPAIAD